MIFPKEFVEEIKDRISASQVVRRRVVLKARSSAEYSGLCPFHNEKSPSFTVNDNKGFFHCFGCGAHGNIFDFVMRTEGLNFPEAVEKLALEAGMRLPKADPKFIEKLDKDARLVACAEAAAKFFKAQLLTSNGYRAREYLQSRGLTQQTIEEFNLGFAPDIPNLLKNALLEQKFTVQEMETIGIIKNNYEMFRGRLIFPITNTKGRAIAFGGRIMGVGEPKYLNSPETPIFHKRKILFGKAIARKFIHETKEAIVCEGYMDVISLNQAGFKNAVAPLGTSLTEEHLQELWAMAPEPTLCFDGDSAGIRAAARAANLALPFLQAGKSLKFVQLPKGKDPDDVAKENPELLKKLLLGAKSLSEMVYETEKELKSIITPEQQADFKARLEAKAKEIKNTDISKNYADFFKNRLWQEFKGKQAQNTSNSASSGVVKLSVARATSQKIEQIQLYLLGAVIGATELLNDTNIQEELANLEIEQVEIDKLRQNILQTIASDAFDFNEVIELLPHGLNAEVKKGMAFVKKQPANEAWNSLMESYYMELNQKEVEENDSCDEEDFYRLQELVVAKQKINQKNND